MPQQEIFDQTQKITKSTEFYTHFSGVEHENGNKKRITPIKKGDMPIAPLIEIILDNNHNVTLISESPLLEHDAVYIRLQVEKAIMKRTGKEEAYYKDLSEVV